MPDIGIIPMRMGTRALSASVRLLSEDHPHAYGDKFLPSFSFVLSLGSSPRVWGQAMSHLSFNFLLGIIPTRMGTSAACVCGSLNTQDHPHAYGDKQTQFAHSLGTVGSSPRVWGQVVVQQASWGRRGIIPTRMGTSLLTTLG